jgi:hypothetical protein
MNKTIIIYIVLAAVAALAIYLLFKPEKKPLDRTTIETKNIDKNERDSPIFQSWLNATNPNQGLTQGISALSDAALIYLLQNVKYQRNALQPLDYEYNLRFNPSGISQEKANEAAAAAAAAAAKKAADAAAAQSNSGGGDNILSDIVSIGEKVLPFALMSL